MPIDYSRFERIGDEPPRPQVPEKEKSARRNQAMLRCLDTGQPVSASGGCFSCGLVVPGKLLNCGGCHYARYCTRSCQRKHWAVHRADCLRRRAHKVDAAGTFVDMRTKSIGVCTQFRKLCVLPPRSTQTVGSCYGCGILLKKTVRDAANAKGEDSLGVFWVTRPPGPPPTRHLASIKLLCPQDFVGVCLHCARAFSKDEAVHVKRCHRWLDLGPALSAETLLQRRLRASIKLHAQPTVASLGCAAGVLRRNGLSVPFAEGRLEGWAFPALGLREDSGWRPGEDARHYAFARLYSADPRFREDADYVAFLAQRSAAAGDAEFWKFCAEALPAPVPALALAAAPLHTATFWRFEETKEGHAEDAD